MQRAGQCGGQNNAEGRAMRRAGQRGGQDNKEGRTTQHGDQETEAFNLTQLSLGTKRWSQSKIL